VTGYSTTTYIKCNDDYILFAGPQRSRLVVASAADGRLLWQRENGNLQLVLRDDGFYAAGPGDIGRKYDYRTGEVLAKLPRRRACTRATGTLDSIFYRTPGGTVRVQTPSNTAQHIAPMRPPCQDGVIISDGNLYWGPWMCGCQLSLYGHICLTSGLGFEYRPGLDPPRLESESADSASVQPFQVREGDWPAYCADNGRSMVSGATLPEALEQKWSQRIASGDLPTAPVAAGGLVFVADRNGVVKALDASDGSIRWQAYTAGPVYFPPAVDQGRAFVGSADGHVYAFEAATGKRLWRFRAAPVDHKIPVYGKLISRWPVAGGVVVQDGVVYAAAGIAHYDGTHVYALDAATGQVKWYNDSSGTISEQVNCGASLQGNLHIRDGELRFLGGGAYEIARYALDTGKCLNAPHDGVNSRFHTSFYAYFPDYGKYLSLDHTLDDGRSLVYDASYEGSQHSALAMQAKPAPGTPKVVKPASRWPVRRRGQPPATNIWQDKKGRKFNAFVVTDELLLAAGEAGSPDAPQALLAVIGVEDGADISVNELPSPAVKGGLAVDHERRVFVTLENGQLICLAGKAG
jgi:outer membrane protein assembly factor BamB